MRKSLRCAAAVALVFLVGCTSRTVPMSDGEPPYTEETPVAPPLENGQTLRVTIADGRFGSRLYEDVTGATRMLVITQGGPYVFEIDRLVAAREVAADSETMITYDLSAPGQYTMRAYVSTPMGTSATSSSAVLQVSSLPGVANSP